MQELDLIYLSRQDVIDTGITLAESVGIVEDVLREHAAREFENPKKPALHPRKNTFLHAMPANLKRKKQLGMKWVSGFFDNPKRGLPSLSGLIVLNDAETGIPTAVLDGTYITALRTAAVSGVAAKYLANPGAEVLGIVGTGLQGRYNLLTLKDILPYM